MNTQSKTLEERISLRSFFIAMSYATKYGHYNPRDPQMTDKAENEFGNLVNRQLGIIDTCTEYGFIDGGQNG